MKLKRPTKFIKTLELENFQSHKYLKLNLSEGFNVITGTNNAGKTAIWRAIDFIFNFGKRDMEVLILPMFLTRHLSVKLLFIFMMEQN